MSEICCSKITVTGSNGYLKQFNNAFKGRGPLWGITLGKDDGVTEGQLLKLRRKNTADHKKRMPHYSLNALYPVPKTILDSGYYRENKTPTERLKENVESSWSDGYSWCCKHWGVKCDLDEFTGIEIKDCELIYTLFTPYSPPLEWLMKVAADWPKLNFKLVFEESGSLFAGCVLFEKGQLIKGDYAVGADYRDFVIKYLGWDPLEGFEKKKVNK